MKHVLQSEIDKTLTELIELLSSIEEKKFNIVPFEGSWTAGQLAQHMIIANSGVVETINGPLKETERKPDKLVEEIRSSFLNFNIKMESPEFLRPPKKHYNKQELLPTLNNIKEQLIEATKTSDLTKTCIAFEFPVLGYLTGLEAIHFVLSHTQRHIHQLKKILEKLALLNSISLT